MKKFLAMILAAMMLLTLAAPLAAAAGDPPLAANGTITIANAKENVTYNIYRILDLYSYNEAENAYAYKTNSTWLEFIRDEAKGASTTEPATQVPMFLLYPTETRTITETDPDTGVTTTKTVTEAIPDEDGNYYAVWNSECDQSAENIVKLARDAVAYAKENSDSISPVDTKKADANGNLVFNEGETEGEQLKLGYYVISTSLGTLCSLDTAKPNATVYDKNPVPTVDKFVQEDSLLVQYNKEQADDTIEDTDKLKLEATWLKKNDADIGQVVKYKSVIKVAPDAQTEYVKIVNQIKTLEDAIAELIIANESLADGSDAKNQNLAAIETKQNELAPLKAQEKFMRETINTGSTVLIYHDLLSSGLTLNPDSITVKLKAVDSTTEVGIPVDTDHYQIGTKHPDDVYGYNYVGCTECTFYVAFSSAYLSTLKLGDQLIIYYDAVLNENAVIAGEGNPNDGWITYGYDQKSAVIRTTTYTYGIELLKYEMVEGKQTKLDGATFTLKNADGDTIKLVKTAGATGTIDYTTYRVAIYDSEESEYESGAVDSFAAGQVRIIGLDGRTSYTLREVSAPAGYNKLDLDIGVELEEANKYIEKLTKYNENGFLYNGGIQVENKKGSILPSTGGIGTTIFYIVGGLMMAAAVVLLVTKRKMAAEDNE